MCADRSTQNPENKPAKSTGAAVPPPAVKPALPPAVEPTTIEVPTFRSGQQRGTVSVDLSKAVPLIENIIVGMSPRIGLDRNGGYGRNPGEIEAGKLIQGALNKGLEALGSKQRIAVDGDIRPGGETARAVDKFIELANTKRTAPYTIPSGTHEIGTVLLAELAKYEPKLLDRRWPVSPNVTGETLQALRPVLAREKFVSQGADAGEVNRLVTVATTKDDRIKDYKISGPALTGQTLEAINTLQITNDGVDTVGPATVKRLLRRVVELDRGVKHPKLGGGD